MADAEAAGKQFPAAPEAAAAAVAEVAPSAVAAVQVSAVGIVARVAGLAGVLESCADRNDHVACCGCLRRAVASVFWTGDLDSPLNTFQRCLQTDILSTMSMSPC